MVAKSDVVTAQSEIEKSLQDFVLSSAAAKVYVFETESHHLRALVGSDGFRGMPLWERQETVWAYLREHVPDEFLVHLVAVHTWDLDEYDENVREV